MIYFDDWIKEMNDNEKLFHLSNKNSLAVWQNENGPFKEYLRRFDRVFYEKYRILF